MHDFICNIAIAIWAFSGWYLAGLGPAFLLLPRFFRRKAWLLAPLIGMCLLVVISLFKITVLLMPLSPRLNIVFLICISLLLYCVVWRYDLRHTRKESYPDTRWLWLLPSVFLLFFAWMFHNGGFQLLIGGSDELQYSANARQIAEEMHTGSSLDIPIPRQDYFVYEQITRTLPYLKTYRRGAEVMLASTAAVTGLTYEEAFPITILCVLLTLGLTLGFLGHVFFRLSLVTIMILQLTFLSSFYFILLHIQGSLALMTSIAPCLMGLALLSRVARAPSWRWVLLATIVVAAYLSIYSEPSSINMLLPSVLLVIWQFQRSRSQGFGALRRIGLVYLMIAICVPFAIYAVVQNTHGNFSGLYANFLSKLTTPVNTLSTTTHTLVHDWWPVATVILGSNSYYDMSNMNNKIAQFVAHTPSIGWIAFYVLCMSALLGYLKTRNRFGRLLAIILVIWALVAPILLRQGDTLQFTRSLHYSMPFGMLGLVLLANPYRASIKRWNTFWVVITWIGRVILIVFIFLNLCTSIRTIFYVTSHHVSNDPIVLRFNEKFTPWRQLKEELHISAVLKAPVLLSGFNDTVKPLALAIAMRSQPHVLGESLLHVWPIYDIKDIIQPDKQKSHKFNTIYSGKEIKLAQNKIDPWSKVEADLVERSLQAVVRIGNGYPVEWAASQQDVYAPRIKRISNICDIVYRNEYSVVLRDNMLSPVKKDGIGLYRLLKKSGPIIIRDFFYAPQQLVITYEGHVSDIQLQNKTHIDAGEVQKHDNQINIAFTIQPEDVMNLHLIVSRPVKLRSMSWMPIS